MTDTPQNDEYAPVDECPMCGWGTTRHGGRAGVLVCPNCGWDSDYDDAEDSAIEAHRDVITESMGHAAAMRSRQQT